MQIFVNGDIREVPEGTSMSALIEHLGLGEQRIAVEVNAELVPRSQFGGRRLAPDDRIEIIRAVGGG